MSAAASTACCWRPAPRSTRGKARARPLLEEVLERTAAGPRRAEALHKLAYLVEDAGALAMAEAALDEAGDDDELCADIELSAALFAEMGGKPERSRQLVESAAARAEAAGLTLLLSQALSALAFRRHTAGEGVQRSCSCAPTHWSARRRGARATTRPSRSSGSS